MAGFASITGQPDYVYADNASFDGTERGGGLTTNGQLWIGNTLTGRPTVNTLKSTNSTVTFTNGNGSINLSVTGGGYSPGTWVVDPVVGKGNFQTITAAMAAASSGDTVYVRPGTYTENFTLGSGVYLQACTTIGSSDNVIITGKITFTGAASATVSGFKINTNGDYCIVHSGSNAATLNFKDCFITGSSSSSINYTNSNASSGLRFFNCVFNISGASHTHFVSTSPGILSFFDGQANSSADTTASTASSTVIFMRYISWAQPITLSTSGSIDARFCNITSINVLSLNIGSGVTATIQNSSVISGTGVAIQADGTVSLYESIIISSNVNAITGGGTLNYTGVDFPSSSTISTTTKNPVALTVFQGGTGLISTTANQLLVSTATNVIGGLTAGTSGQVLIGSTGAVPVFSTLTSTGGTIAFTTGAGTLNLEVVSGGVPWTDVTGATQTLAVENGYATDRGGGVTYTLPSTAAFGDVIMIVGKAGLATVAQNALQAIIFGSSTTTVGITGSIVATNAGDCVTLRCTTSGTSTRWTVQNSVGNWTIN